MSSQLAQLREDPKVTVAVPLFNEELTVDLMLDTVAGVLAGLPRSDHEILCVNDGRPTTGLCDPRLASDWLFRDVAFGAGGRGEYVGRIYEEVKQRPVYIVDTVIEKES